MSQGEREGPSAGARRVRFVLILLCALVGVVYLAIASASTRIVDVPLSAQLGLLQLLPAAFWAGLGLIGLAVALAVREGSDALVLVTGCLFLAVLAGTPSLFEPNPRYWDAYLHFGEAQVILSTGHLPAGSLGEYSANWPGFFLVAAALSAASGLSPMAFLGVYPFLSGGITFLALFLFLRSIVPRTVAAPGAVLASLLDVWAQYHVSPQSLGLVLALLVLAVVWRQGRRWQVTSLVLFLGLVPTHPTSTLLLLAILVTMSVFGLVWGRSSADAKRDARLTRRVTALYGAIWLGWLGFRATGSSQVAQTAILTRMGALISLPENAVSLASARTGENLFPVAPYLRLGALGVFALLGFVGLFLLRRRSDTRPLARFLFAAIVGVGVVAGADILGFGGQFYDRSLLLFATFAPAMVLVGLRTVRLPKRLARTVAIVLVGASLAAASTAYYQEAFYHVTDGSVAVSQFLQRVPPQSPVLDGMYPVPVWIDPATRTSVVRVAFYEMYPRPSGEYVGSMTAYAVFDPTAELWYLQWRGIDVYSYYEAEQANRTLIYDNGWATITVRGGPT